MENSNFQSGNRLYHGELEFSVREQFAPWRTRIFSQGAVYTMENSNLDLTIAHLLNCRNKLDGHNQTNKHRLGRWLAQDVEKKGRRLDQTYVGNASGQRWNVKAA